MSPYGEGPVAKKEQRCLKSSFIWDEQLFGGTPLNLNVFMTGWLKVEVLKLFHDYIDHWDFEYTRHFVVERYWWPIVASDVHEYV